MVVSNNQQGTSKAFTLTIGGRDYLNPGEGQAYVPVDEYPITWSDTIGNSVGSLNVTVFDPAPLWADRVPLKTGQEVLFKRADGNIIFGGVVVAIRWHRAIVGRYAELQVSDFNAWLDWRIVPRLHNKKNTSSGKKVRYTAHDDVLIKSRLFGSDRRHGPLTTYGGFVERTTGSTSDEQMSAGFEVQGATLRTALEEIAEEANHNGVERRFYVDHQKRLHYYERRENANPAPFRVTDQEYAALVNEDGNLVEYWDFREGAAGSFIGRKTGAEMLVSGDAASDGERLVPNGPFDAVKVTGATSILSNDVASFTASGGWGIHGVWKFDSLASAQYLMVTTNGDDDGPEVLLLASGDVRVTNRADSTYTTFDTNLTTGNRYFIAAGVKADGTPYVYVNGDSKSVSGTGGGGVTLSGDGWTRMYICNVGSPLTGQVSHFAWYDGNAITPTQAAALRFAGVGITVEGHEWTEDSESETHAVYVRGKNALGSGWTTWGSGTFSHAKQDYLNRPKVDTSKRRNRTARNFLRRQENRYTGSFAITDPDHAVGWRAGQTLYVDDSGIGFTADDTYQDGTSRQPFEVVNVSGSMSGGQEVRLDIEYGTLKRTILRALARR
jgi:hypothetical protein